MRKIQLRLSKYRVKKIRKIAQRILIIHWGGFGDFLITTPFLEALRKNFPRAHISCVLSRRSKNSSKLLEHNPNVDRYIRSSVSILAELLMEKPYDLVIDLCDNETSQLMVKVSGAKIKLWGGFLNIRTATHFFYSDALRGSWSPPLKINLKKGIYSIKRFLELARFLGAETKKSITPKVYFTQKENYLSRKYLRAFKDKDTDIIIALHPGGRSPHRLWKTRNYALLADRLIEKYNPKVKVLVFYARREKHFADQVCRFSRHKLCKIRERDVRKYASIISGCNVFISTDGGPLQMALASGVPSVGIFNFKESAAEWYDYKKRESLFSVFAKPNRYPKRSVNAKNINKQDREEVKSALEKTEEALRFKNNA